GIVTPLLFLFRAHGLVKAASVILGLALSLAFLDNLSVISNPQLGRWKALSLPWLLMFGACIGYYILAVFAERWYDDDPLNSPVGRRWDALKFVRAVIAIGFALAALELGREGLDYMGQSSQFAGAAGEIMARHYQ